MTANASVLVCLAHGSEETEAVTTIDLLVRAGLNVVTASVESDGNREIVCSRGVRLLADVTLVEVADNDFAAIVLPNERIVAAICAAAGTVLIPHDLFPVGNMTGFPGLKETIPSDKWMERRVVWDPRVNLLTSQGPGTAMDFALKLIDLLVGKEMAREVAAQLVLAPGIYDYQA
jgi:4-methyl-5(b-hydroxyethyl)-thiazole monophosphate biosynthesis